MNNIDYSSVRSLKVLTFHTDKALEMLSSIEEVLIKTFVSFAAKFERVSEVNVELSNKLIASGWMVILGFSSVYFALLSSTVKYQRSSSVLVL